MITIDLPFPVSVNKMYRNASKGRKKTDRYRVWLRAAMNEIITQRVQWRVPRVPGKINVAIQIERKDNRKRDIDNLIKCCLDVMVEMNVIDDDSNVEALSIAYGPVTGAQVEVRAA